MTTTPAEVTTNDGPDVPPERPQESTSVFRADFLADAESPAQEQSVSGVDGLPPGSALLVVRRGPNDRKAKGDVDGVFKVQRLDRDQRLVVVHAERCIIFRPRGRVEQGVRRVWTGHSPSFGGERGDRRAGQTAHCGLLEANVVRWPQACAQSLDGTMMGSREQTAGDIDI